MLKAIQALIVASFIATGVAWLALGIVRSDHRAIFEAGDSLFFAILCYKADWLFK